MFDKLKQIKELRDQAKRLQETLSQVTVTEQSSDGAILVTLDGNMNITHLKIDDPERADELKNLLNTAIKEAQKKAAEMMRASGGFNIPGLS